MISLAVSSELSLNLRAVGVLAILLYNSCPGPYYRKVLYNPVKTSRVHGTYHSTGGREKGSRA